MLRQVCYVSIALALCVVGSSLLAQQPVHPNTDRGFKPEAAFQMGDVDNINLFNGQLTLTIPIGPSLPMAAGNSYGLTLVYSSRVWDYRSASNCVQGGGDIPEQYVVQAFPAMHSNAGMGWLLSLGRLVDPDMPDYHYYVNPEAPEVVDPLSLYESPDGSRHFFYPTLHQGNAPYTPDPTKPDPTMGPITSMGYTRDGSYLRKKTYSSGWVDVESPDGLIRRFNPSGELILIQDPFGNHVNVVMTRENPNDPASPIDKIELKDQHLRTTTVRFRAYGSPYKNYTRIVERVELPAFGGGTASYEFYYSDETKVLRGYTPSVQECTGLVYVPILSEILLPASATGSRDSFKFVYNDFAHMAGGGDADTNYQGTIREMTLPTGGSVSWRYQNYELPSEGCDFASWFDRQIGVKERTLKGVDGSVVGIWRYGQDMGPEFVTATPCSAHLKEWDTGQPPNSFPRILAHYVTTTVAAPNQEPGATADQTGTKTEYLFSSWKGPTSHANGADSREYGLPFARLSATLTDPPFLSTRTYSSESGPAIRSTFVEYARDNDTGSNGNSYHSTDFDGNRRLVSQTTVFDDDGGLYVWHRNSDYDGFGHYRTVISGGTLGTADSLTRYTAYNENGTGQRTDAEGEYAGTFALTATDRWLPNLFTEQVVSAVAPGVQDASRALFCFDRATGFLEGKRSLLSHVPDAEGYLRTTPADILVRFARDDTGNTTEEQYFGGDSNTDDYVGCNSGSLVAKYRLLHTYEHGALATSRDAAAPFLLVDNTIDAGTGNVSSVRDSAGVETTFDYDKRGRLTQVAPTGQSVTRYAYAGPVGTDGASVKVEQWDAQDVSVLGEQKFGYDGLGRLRSVEVKVPSEDGASTTWVRTRTDYNALGGKTRVYEPAATTATGSIPATTFSGFDPFGRPSLVTRPDDSTTRFSFIGQRQSSRTVTIQRPTGPSDSTTTEVYDNHGRLSDVTEPAGLNESLVTTGYSYDAGGRLTKVCARKVGSICGQSRFFVYDGRGFLREERHPESGTTYYDSYDTRGLLGLKQKANPSVSDQTFSYDSMGRLLQVKARNPYYMDQFRILKEYGWGDANLGANLVRGKLAWSSRHNYITFLGDIHVIEDYGYGDPAGRRTDRTTTIVNETYFQTVNVLKQQVEFDSLGNIVSEDYPDCDWQDCGTSPRKFERVNRSYTLGRLTGIESWAGLQKLDVVKSIRYHLNGMVSRVEHGNNVTETVALDPSGMPRPRSFTFSPYSECAVPTITAHPQGQTVFIGNSVTLAVSATGAALRYQWYNADGPIENASQPSYTTGPLTQNGTFWVRVSTWCGQIDSSGAEVGLAGAISAQAAISVLSCGGPPTIESQPQGTTIASGETATLSVSASGTGPYTYQWFEGATGDATTPVGGNSASFPTGALTVTTQYWVKVTNDCGPANSATATVTVRACAAAPGVGAQPLSSTIPNGQTVTLLVDVTGTGPFTYQWYLGASGTTTSPVGTNSPGFTSPALTTTTQYWVRIWNECGGVNSQTATVTVLACSTAPGIATPPLSQTVALGQTATLTVAASGVGPFSYQWYVGPSGTTTTPVGTNAPSYTTPALSASTAYWVRVSNACGSVNSQAATIEISAFATPTRRQLRAGIAVSSKYPGVSWGMATQQDSLLLAFVATGTSVGVAPPTGWTLAGRIPGRISVYAIQGASPRSGFEMFTLSNYTHSNIVLVEYTGVATSGALDRMATATGTGNTASSGMTAITSQPNELIVTLLASSSNGFGAPTNGFTLLQQLSLPSAVHERIVTTTGSYGHTSPLTTPANWYGLVLSWRARALD